MGEAPLRKGGDQGKRGGMVGKMAGKCPYHHLAGTKGLRNQSTKVPFVKREGIVAKEKKKPRGPRGGREGYKGERRAKHKDKGKSFPIQKGKKLAEKDG